MGWFPHQSGAFIVRISIDLLLSVGYQAMPAPVSSLVSNVTDSLFNFTLTGLVQIIAEACTFTAFIFGVIYVFFIIPKFLNSVIP